MSVIHWARFRSEGRVGFGVLEEGRLFEYEGDLFGQSRPTGRRFEPGSFTLLNPCEPSKIVGLWNNFHALAVKIGKAPPSHPLFFIKPATSVVGPGEPIVRPASVAGKIIFEGELGIVLGRRCKEVSVDEADSYILGYTCVNDVTAVDVLGENVDFAQWCRSKSYDTFGCIGPVIAAGFDWSKANVVAKLDGVERQNYPLADMIMPPAQIVSMLSHDMSLLPGDVIACGTSLGVGSIKDGVTVEISIPGIGCLSNRLIPDKSQDPRGIKSA